MMQSARIILYHEGNEERALRLHPEVLPPEIVSDTPGRQKDDDYA